MTTTYSGNLHRHHHPSISVATDRRTISTDDEDSNNSEMITNNNPDHHPENPVSKTTATSRKLPLKPHRRHQRSIPVTGKSSPVNIPEWPKILRDSYKLRSHGDQYVVDDDDDEWLPPHEYLARIRSASLSVHEGVGRTLKGRDLSSLRNAIWKQTGFDQD